ncbi:uncharacterized protein N7477_000888 [Penicillium maclennaniae]|uniref:uncharacterized protein n=1 Tax=Penicillium maclennaniae TaxID=1343394 RepID=UPI002541E47A|nr:uncharacterized protein N7477_000888 [Penicillium maclennaniae]KAJ5684543.1 hypothetical protein N7477_000888 [Penicillium maclennaniae]
MKQRFSSLDVKVITQELAAELVNLRVSNIYDLSSRIFLFKLAKPDHKRQLIVDSGFRTHITQYDRTAAAAPSPFVTRLRKFIKSRRITSIEQIGTDRVINISFSDGAYHLFLEFFAGGNIILTDREYTIIALFRQVSAVEGEEAKIGIKYNVTNKQNYNGVPDITADRVRETLEKAQALVSHESNAPKKSKKKKNTDVLRKALSQGFPEYPPLLLDHAFAIKELDPAMPLDQVLGDESTLTQVLETLEEAQRVSNSFNTGDSHPGYIVAKADTRAPVEEETTSKTPGLLYEDFHPFRPRQFEGKPDITILEFERFNATVDEYFSSLESQRLESRLTEKEEAAKRKLEAVREEHRKRIDALKDAQELHIRKADAIQDNMYRVQEAMDAVNGLVAQGMDWGEIDRLIEMEQGRGNPVAQIIKLPLKLHENTVTLILGEVGEEEDEEEMDSSDESDSDSANEELERQKQADANDKMLKIDIDLGLTPWANATQYYEQKKSASDKQQRTLQSSEKALKSHEKKVTADLKKGLKQEKQVLRHAREPFWFEKFIFFISSEGYLVIGARDAMQGELLYRRYLKKGDVFIHADLKDALPIVVKNRSADAPIPPSTLSQAGILCVATSTAWESKAVMSAYWVHPSQVSKVAEVGGGILPVGDFQIKGEKNFLAPSQLVLGFAVLFQISQESVKNHKQHFEISDVTTETSTAERVQPAIEQEPTEESSPEPTAEAREETQQVDESGEEDEDEEDEDKAPVTNPLQRGESKMPARPEITPDVSESESEEEAEEDTIPYDDAEEDGPAENESTTGQDSIAPQQEEQKLSARERRTLRQGKPLDRPAEPAPPRIAPTRGKKAKEKRAAAKYAQQDDEERELALRLLGNNKGKAKAAEAAEAKAQRDREVEATRLRRRAQHERAAQAEQKRQAQLTETGTDDYDPETAAAEAADLSWIPALVGTPTPDDEILGAIAVCAPWGALGRYKYKVKLQPGTVKKGKAVKEIIGRWVHETTTGKVKKDHAEDAGIPRAEAEKLRAREGELIKGWKDTEIINSMPVGKVRIMTPGSAAGGAGGGDKGKGKSGPRGGGGRGKGRKKK